MLMHHKSQTMSETEEHAQRVKKYIRINFNSGWDVDENISEGKTVDICENGDVHYDGFSIIKTGIKL